LHCAGQDGTILRVNQAELDLLGYAREEYIGKHVARFHADGEVINTMLAKLRAGETLRDYPARMRCKDGSIKHVVIDSSVLWENGKFVHTRCFTRDVTHQRRAEEMLHKQTERLRLLWEAAAILLSGDDVSLMLHGLLLKIGPHLGVDGYLNFVVDDTGNALRLASCEGFPVEAARRLNHVELGQAVSGTVAQQRRPIVLSDVLRSTDRRVRALHALGVRAYACNPLLAGDRLLGTLSFASKTKDKFDDAEVSFMETISHYVTVAHERLRLLNELKEADRRKDEFLATLAHELRNPLAPVRNAVQVLRLKGPDEPELRWGRDVIDRQVQHLTRLIDDLMDISRITRNKLDLRMQKVELSEVIKGAVEAVRPAMEQHGHQFKVSLPSQPIHVNGDLVRLAQVFLNLLNNAAKYTEPNGRVELTTELLGNEVGVRVADTGIGIPPEKLPHLFQMFFQVDRSLERAQGGLGIGLSLVRRIVDLHGGRVEAHSAGIGKGSEFIVRLPALPQDDRGRDLAPQEHIANGTSAIRCIVIADDNRDSADSLGALLRLRGNTVYTAYDGLEAVSLIERAKPDVVLLDIAMPRLNGYDACRRIREADLKRQIRLIAMTGWGQEADRRRTLEAGFDFHLVKPVDLAALTEILDSPSIPTPRGLSEVGLSQ
jgi:PAS domain S-box-containing protein